MNWRVVGAVTVAFVVGGAAGAFVEHERVQDSSSSKSPKTPAQQVSIWFGSKSAEACPSLKAWSSALSGAALSGITGDWAVRKVALLQSSNASAKALQDLIPLTRGEGTTELSFLIDVEKKSQQALKGAQSLADYETFQKTLSAERLRNDTAVLVTASGLCPKT